MSEQQAQTDNTNSSEQDSLAEANAQAQIAAEQDRAQGTGAFSHEAHTYTGAEVRANFNTARAISQDERGRHTVSQTPPRQRSWQSRRASSRAYQAEQQRVKSAHRQVQAWLSPRLPSAAYAKGEDTHMYMGDCVPSGWWYSFWRTVGALLSGRR
jgi:hypothetical protein